MASPRRGRPIRWVPPLEDQNRLSRTVPCDALPIQVTCWAQAAWSETMRMRISLLVETTTVT
jgi:hypothetical protein